VVAFPRGHLAKVDELCLLEGLSDVANSLPSFDAVARASQKMMAPVQARLAACAAALGTAAASALAEQRGEVQAAAEQFQEMVKQLTKAPPDGSLHHPAVAALHMVWASLDVCLTAYAASENMVEKLCRCYKLVMRAAGVHFVPSLAAMAQHLGSHFARSPQPAYLYTGSILITELGGLPAHEPQLMHMLQGLSDAAFARLNVGLAAFTQQPEMVEEYFFLVARFLEYCPALLLSNPNGLLAQVVQCGVVGLQVDHQQAHAGVTSCFYHLVRAGTHAPRGASAGHGGAGPPHANAAAVVALLSSVGGLLVGGLVQGLASERPCYGLEKDKSNPAAVLWQVAQLPPSGPQILSQLLAHALASVPLEVFSDADRGAWTGQLGAAIGANDEGAFFDAVREFNRVCSRKARALARAQERAAGGA
jgi:hypothetical protein